MKKGEQKNPFRKAGRIFLVLFGMIAAGLFGSKQEVCASADVLTVFEIDTRNEWEDKQEISLFDSAYYGDKMIAPGTVGQYRFCIKNDSKESVTASLSFLEENPSEIPLYYVLLEKYDREGTSSSKSLSWQSAADLAANPILLKPGEEKEYSMEWIWRTKSDLLDTSLGIAAREELTYTMTIDITAQIADTGEAYRPGTGDMLSDDTGFMSWGLGMKDWIDLMLGSFLLLLILLYLRKFCRKSKKRRRWILLLLCLTISMMIPASLARMRTQTAGNAKGLAAVYVMESDAEEMPDIIIDYEEGTERYYTASYSFAVANYKDDLCCEVDCAYDLILTFAVSEGKELPAELSVILDGQELPADSIITQETVISQDTVTFQNGEISQETLAPQGVLGSQDITYTFLFENAGRFLAGEPKQQEHEVRLVFDSGGETVTRSITVLNGNISVRARQID